MTFTLCTVLHDGAAVGCAEIDGRRVPLTALDAPAAVIDLFSDWDRWSAHLAAARPGGQAVPDDAPLLAPPRNAVVGPGATVRKPIGTRAFDWEVELAAVIGRRARAVAAADALRHVAAYTVAIDFSARDFNRAPETFYKLDWVAGKAHDTCCPMGPRLVPASAIRDPQDLALRLAVSGETKQDARTSGMIFSIAEQIATLSRIMTLDPGDVVLTGTPAGVGGPKGTFLEIGDRVEAEIEGIGRLAVIIQPEG